MNSLKLFSRNFKGKRYFTAVSGKTKWKNLASFITNEKDLLSWKELNSKIAEAEHVVDTEEEMKTPLKPIDWNEWNSKISNTQLLACMKNFYEHQMKLLDELEGKENFKESTRISEVINREEKSIFDDALKNCEKSKEESEKLLINGAKTLWICFHNPQVENVDNNEWIESDKYWQSFVEKHCVYNLNSKHLEPEDEENITSNKNEWHKKTTKFNERSDTPILYDYMINLPSWEYYDINRRAFLEHVFYFMVKTGMHYKFFPELFHWKWLTHIEDLRFQYLDVAGKRRSQIQMEQLKREVALELQPLDYEHDGDEFHLKLLYHFKDYQNLLLSRLLSNFMFLCDPYIPIQTERALDQILKKYKGKLFKLKNTQVQALFFLADDQNEHTTFKPMDALNNFYTYLNNNNKELNPSFSQLLNIFTCLLEERGEHWLKVHDETMVDSFLRRYNKDDPNFPIFVEYAQELKDQFENVEEIKPQNYKEEIKKVEERYKNESIFFHNFLKTFLSDELFETNQNKVEFMKMDVSKIEQMIRDKEIEMIDIEKNEPIKEGTKLLEYLKKEEENKLQIQEYIKSISN